MEIQKLRNFEILKFTYREIQKFRNMKFRTQKFRNPQNFEKIVVIDSDDTDVYVQSAFVAHKLPGLRIYKNALENNYVDCENLCSSEMADVIIQLTGCDSNSAFFGHGKKKIFDVVKSSEEARTLLKSCGSSFWT